MFLWLTPPQFLNQAPPGAQQLTLPDFANLPHLRHVIVLAIVEVIAGVLTISSRSGTGRRDRKSSIERCRFAVVVMESSIGRFRFAVVVAVVVVVVVVAVDVDCDAHAVRGIDPYEPSNMSF